SGSSRPPRARRRIPVPQVLAVAITLLHQGERRLKFLFVRDANLEVARTEVTDLPHIAREAIDKFNCVGIDLEEDEDRRALRSDLNAGEVPDPSVSEVVLPHRCRDVISEAFNMVNEALVEGFQVGRGLFEELGRSLPTSSRRGSLVLKWHCRSRLDRRDEVEGE